MAMDVTIEPRGASEPAVRDDEGRLVLRSSRWIVRGPAAALSDIKKALGGICERPDDRVLLLSFNNSVGRFTVPHLGTLEVKCGKWSEEHFNLMLHQLTEEAAGLPFSSRQGSGLPYERIYLQERDVPLHAFVYLRYVLSSTAPPQDRLEPALHRILASPHRRMVATGRQVALDRARNVGARGLLRVLESPWTWTP